MTFSIDTKAIDGAVAGLELTDDVIDDVADATLPDLGTSATAAVRSRARRHRVTGRMESQIVARSTGAGVRRTVTVRAGGPMASLVATGSGPHIIRPIRARALRLGGSVLRFASSVRHPGTRPDPFVAAAMDDVEQTFDRTLDVAIDNVAGELAGEISRRV